MDKNIQRYLENRKDERNSALLYEAIANLEKDQKLSEVYNRMAATEIRHATRWESYITDAGVELPVFKPSWRTRILIWLANHIGYQTVLPTIIGMEKDGSNKYRNQPEATDLVSQEAAHSKLLQQLSKTGSGGMEGGMIARLEGRHRNAGGNALRAAVLGASDGLLSNFNLIMGVAGAAVDNQILLLTGFAGLLAGAISMALGEWVSVQSSRELYNKQIETERFEIDTAPEEETEELVLIYQARGLDEATARMFATKIMSNPTTALDTLVRDELGIDPDELGGSAWEAALTSFLLFAVGAILPIIPFFFLQGWTGIVVSALLSAIGLFSLGAAITLFTGRSVFISGIRQVIIGLAAAATTFLVGYLIGVSIS